MTADPLLDPSCSPLPTAVRPRPHHAVLRRGPDSLQFGLFPPHAVEVTGLPPPLLRLLAELAGARRVDELVARAVELGADRGETLGLLVELVAAGALVDAAPRARRVEARRSASVLVSGRGPLVAGVAGALASGGIGRLHVVADGVVEGDEVGCFASAEVGQPRAEAVVREVGRVAPRLRVRPCAPRRTPDLLVLTDALAPDPRRHPALAERGVPQLSVRLADGLGLVGPLVLAKRSTCLRCIDMRRAEVDPHWPVVSAGLTDRVGSASPATVLATAALAAEQVGLALDALVVPGAPPPTLNAVLELDARRGILRRRPWEPHPGCGCGAAHTRPLLGHTSAATSGAGDPPGGTAAPPAGAACEVMPAR